MRIFYLGEISSLSPYFIYATKDANRFIKSANVVLLILEISAIPAPVGNSLIFYIDVVRSDSKYIIENVAYL